MEHVAHETAERIRRRREAAGLNQQILATNAGIALRTLNRIEAGEDARLTTLARIANALGCTVSELLADPLEAGAA